LKRQKDDGGKFEIAGTTFYGGSRIFKMGRVKVDPRILYIFSSPLEWFKNCNLTMSKQQNDWKKKVGSLGWKSDFPNKNIDSV